VREGDRLLLTGGVRDLELLEELAVRARIMGASPLLSVGSDRLDRRVLDEVPLRNLRSAPATDLKLAEFVDVVIDISHRDDEALFSDVPADRLAAMTSAAQTVGDALLKRNVRQISLGNDLTPTTDRARRFGLPLTDLERIYWNGINVDYARLERTGETVRAALARGKTVRVTTPVGTDLTFQIGGTSVLVSDGVISEADLRAGGAACQVWLPAGEVFTTVVEGSAEGKIVQPRITVQGMDIRDLTLTIRGGKVTAMTASAGLADIQRLYEAGGAGRELVGLIDVGINPNVRIPQGSKMQTWMSAGMVTVGIGGNTWAGGNNTSGFFLPLHLSEATLAVEKNVLVDRGTLAIGNPLATIPATTTSTEALRHYRTGLALLDQLRIEEGRVSMEKAVAADPGFAMAHYAISLVAPTYREGLAAIEKALAASTGISEGERLLIQAQQADLTGKPQKNIELLHRAAALYPEDAQARFRLATAHFGANRLDEAIEHLRAARRIDPLYSPAANLLGYGCMRSGQFPEAEQAFRTYIDLVPGEANPYDSYAEFLMKTGRFDESIALYQKALATNPAFFSAQIGIANNLILKGLPAEARAHLQKAASTAPSDTWRRALLTTTASSYVSEGKYDQAAQEIRNRQAIAAAVSDQLALAADQRTLGALVLESTAFDASRGTYLKTRTPEPSRLTEAATDFSNAEATVAQAPAAQEVKDAIRLGHLTDQVELALRRNDLTAARARADEYRTLALSRGNPEEIRTIHALTGMIAVREKRYEEAINELHLADTRDPETLFHLMEANEGKGDAGKALELRRRIAGLNEPSLAFFMVRRRVTP
jgi:leucyl aminopeptidase (aminopeptidase T)/tetratricopeptide (TPR) repeat protein